MVLKQERKKNTKQYQFPLHVKKNRGRNARKNNNMVQIYNLFSMNVATNIGGGGGGGRGGSAVERATPGEEVPGSIPAVAARSLQAGSVSV